MLQLDDCCSEWRDAQCKQRHPPSSRRRFIIPFSFITVSVILFCNYIIAQYRELSLRASFIILGRPLLSCYATDRFIVDLVIDRLRG